MALNSSRSFSFSSIWTCHVAISAICQSSAAPAWDRVSSLASTLANSALRLLRLLTRETRERRRLLAFLLSTWKALHSEQFLFLHRPCLLLHCGLLSGSLMQGRSGPPFTCLACRRRLVRLVVSLDAMLVYLKSNNFNEITTNLSAHVMQLIFAACNSPLLAARSRATAILCWMRGTNSFVQY